MNGTMIFFVFGAVVVFFVFVRSLLRIMFNLDKLRSYEKRMNQLSNVYRRNPNDSTQFIAKVTNPILSLLNFDNNPYKIDRIRRDLKMIGWNKYFTPQQYLAFGIFLKAIGLGFLLFFALIGEPIIGAVWCVILWVIYPFLFNNAVKEKKQKIFNEFPDFVRVTQGYLMADMTLVDSIERVSTYSGEAWKPILEEFLVTSHLKSQQEAIQDIRDNIDIYEVRELFSLINLSYEQDTDIKESFEREIAKVKKIREIVYESKLAKRQIFGQLLQGPLILTLFISFGLPIFANFMTGF